MIHNLPANHNESLHLIRAEFHKVGESNQLRFMRFQELRFIFWSNDAVIMTVTIVEHMVTR